MPQGNRSKLNHYRKNPRSKTPRHCNRIMRRVYTTIPLLGKPKMIAIGWFCPSDLYTTISIPEEYKKILLEMMKRKSHQSKYEHCDGVTRRIYADISVGRSSSRWAIGWLCPKCLECIYDMDPILRDEF